MKVKGINKITILGPAHPFRGGIASFNERLAKELQNSGKTINIITYTTQYPSLIFPGKNQLTTDPKPETLHIERSFSTINPLTWKSTVQKIKTEKPDLLISRFWLPYTSLSTNYIHRKIKKESGIRQLSIVDNLIPHQHMPGDDFIINQFLNSIEYFICLSSGVLDDVIQRKKTANAEKILHPIYDHYGNNITKKAAAKTLNVNPEFNYILFFGFIKPYKGLDLLLDCLDVRFLQEQKIKVLIAGDVYGSSKVYDDIISKKDLSEYVIFHKDYIPNEKVVAYFSLADLIVQPYRTATQSGISQIALHFEKPVVVTDVGSLSDFVADGKSGYVVPVDKSDIMNAIRKHFLNKDKSMMATSIREQKSKFSWEEFANKLLAFAEKIPAH